MSWHIPDPDTQAEFYKDVPFKRFMAFLIDTVPILILAAIGILFTAFTALFVLPFFLLVVSFVYRAATLAQGSATWGMRVMAIEFRHLNGERLSAGTAILHAFLFTMCWTIPVFQGISMLLMALGPKGQGIPDLALGTVALNRRSLG